MTAVDDLAECWEMPMSRRRPAPPDLEPEFWARPDLVAAVRLGHLGRFIAAYRGAGHAWASQDDLARWIGEPQSTVSRLENDLAPVTPRRLDAVFGGLHVPVDLRRMWGGGRSDD